MQTESAVQEKDVMINDYTSQQARQPEVIIDHTEDNRPSTSGNRPGTSRNYSFSQFTPKPGMSIYDNSDYNNETVTESNNEPNNLPIPLLQRTIYHIGEEIGHGTFSNVFIITKIENIKPIAKKYEHLCVKIQKNNELATDSIIDEIATLTAINSTENSCPYIMQIVDSFVYNGIYCLVLPYYPSVLSNVIKDRYFELKKTETPIISFDFSVRITQQLLIALDFLHNKGYIHADIKIENILLTKKLEDIHTTDDIHIIVSDFGSIVENKNDGFYSEHIQTLEYQAPEIPIGYPISEKIDIWSVACVFYEMLTGNYLFDVTDRAVSETRSESSGSYYSEYSSHSNHSDHTYKDKGKDVIYGGNANDNNTEINNTHDAHNTQDANDSWESYSAHDESEYSYYSDDSDTKNERMHSFIHLQLIKRLIGDMPKKMIKRGNYSATYFNANYELYGSFGDYQGLREFIQDNLRSRPGISNSSVNKIYDFMSKCLVYEPEKRLSAKELLESELFKIQKSINVVNSDSNKPSTNRSTSKPKNIWK